MSNSIRSLGVVDDTEEEDLPAGDFSSWLRLTRSAQGGDPGAQVPCGECNACCRSSYFIHVGPEETETLARIPEELLFPAPGRSKGHVLLGYDELGHCPMLVDDACSIYEHRPRACRDYDCRVFPAAGISLGEDDKPLIARQTLRWKFSYPSERDRGEHAAVRAAAAFLRERAECFTGGVPKSSTELALLAIKVYDVFLRLNDESRETGCVRSDPEVAKAVMEVKARFEARR